MFNVIQIVIQCIKPQITITNVSSNTLALYISIEPFKSIFELHLVSCEKEVGAILSKAI